MRSDPQSVFELFAQRAQDNPDNSFIAIPERLVDAWGWPTEVTYGSALDMVNRSAEQYSARGYGTGDIIALALDSRPQQLIHHLALNKLGACSVPLNPDLSEFELAHLIEHSGCSVIVTASETADRITSALAHTGPRSRITSVDLSDLPHSDPARPTLPTPEPVQRRSAAILYTSGTTGKPKGCVIDNAYALKSGLAYGSPEPDLTLRPGIDRVLNPLPMFHMNTLMMTVGGVIDRSACLVLPGRFSLSHWWSDVRETRATRIHYLGLMIPALLTAESGPHDTDHHVVNAFGAGVDPGARVRFEDRFGISLIEVWGMTETGRGLYATPDQQNLGDHVCGRPQSGVEARIEREDGSEANPDEVGELVVRDAGDDPRHGFFTGYLHDDEATEEAWRGGWFHTGDLFRRSPAGVYSFVDRRKNIIRRSGENISSAEVESALASSSHVAHVAVVPITDRMRGEEVLACIVVEHDDPDDDLARTICAEAAERLTHFKVPGWIRFVHSLPTTGTQKVLKHLLVPSDFDEDRPPAGMHDCRHLKKRPTLPETKAETQP